MEQRKLKAGNRKSEYSISDPIAKLILFTRREAGNKKILWAFFIEYNDERGWYDVKNDG